MRDPAHVTGPVPAKGEGRIIPLGWGEQSLDLTHGAKESPSLALREPGQKLRDLLARGSVQRRERGPAGLGQIEKRPTTILGRRRTAQETRRLEPLQDAAQVARIHAEIPDQVAGAHFRPRRQFIEHARFGERESAVEKALVQEVDLARVEAGKGPDLCNRRVVHPATLTPELERQWQNS
jgi:hypothetical protein